MCKVPKGTINTNNFDRGATIVAAEECHLGLVDKITYNEFFKSDRVKEKSKEEYFLLNNFFMRKIQHKYFSLRYFAEFIEKTFSYGDELFCENDPIDCLYFIKSGEISISFIKSLTELDDMIVDFSKKCEYKYNVKGYNYKLKSHPINFNNELHDKKEIKVINEIYLIS